jgi:hypothetical protein
MSVEGKSPESKNPRQNKTRFSNYMRLDGKRRRGKLMHGSSWMNMTCLFHLTCQSRSLPEPLDLANRTTMSTTTFGQIVGTSLDDFRNSKNRGLCGRRFLLILFLCQHVKEDGRLSMCVRHRVHADFLMLGDLRGLTVISHGSDCPPHPVKLQTKTISCGNRR